MSIERKVKLVEELFYKLEIEINTFQSTTSLHCISGCGKCCTTPHIEASPLEFLPWAFHLFLNHKAEETLLELRKSTTSSCYVYRPLNVIDKNNGSCSNYRYRGLICRLFGYAASKDQHGQLRIATCKIIKENQQKKYQETAIAIKNGLYIPIFSDYYMNLSQIDFVMGKKIMPINEALVYAIEEVLQYYNYRPFPDTLLNIA